MTEQCRTQKRHSQAVCRGLRKGHDGPHNWVLPDGTTPPPPPPPVEDLSVDEKLELVAEAWTKQTAEMIDWLVDTIEDHPYVLNSMARQAQRGEKMWRLTW